MSSLRLCFLGALLELSLLIALSASIGGSVKEWKEQTGEQ